MTESTALATTTPTRGLAIGNALFTPENLKEAMEMAKLIADSDLVPKDYKGKPGNVMVAMGMGAELGVPPLQAVQNIAVINGRPTVWGDLLLAIIKQHPQFQWIVEEPSPSRAIAVMVASGFADEARARALLAGLKDEPTNAVCVLKRQGQPEIVRNFSQEMAIQAGLAKKEGPWQQYPARQRQMRARGFASRDGFADALRGMSVREEVEDYEDVTEAPQGAVVQMPRRKSDAPAVEISEVQTATTAAVPATAPATNAAPQQRASGLVKSVEEKPDEKGLVWYRITLADGGTFVTSDSEYGDSAKDAKETDAVVEITYKAGRSTGVNVVDDLVKKPKANG